MNVDACAKDCARAIFVGRRKPPAIIAIRALTGFRHEGEVERHPVETRAFDRTETRSI